MAKRNKDDTPNPNSVANRDILQRLNFLYQASAYLDSLSARTSTPEPQSPSAGLPATVTAPETTYKERKKLERLARRKREVCTADIARTYVRSMKQIGQKTMVKMDPSVKRTLCQGCDTILVPGVSAMVRVNTSSTHGNTIATTCLQCRHTRRIPAPPAPDEESSSGVSTSEAVPMPAERRGPNPTGGRRRPGKRARQPPLFERDVDHIEFRGNVQV